MKRVRRGKILVAIEKMHANSYSYSYKWMETTYQRDYKKPQLVLTPRAKAPLCHPFWTSANSSRPWDTTYQHDYNIPFKVKLESNKAQNTFYLMILGNLL